MITLIYTSVCTCVWDIYKFALIGGIFTVRYIDVKKRYAQDT